MFLFLLQDTSSHHVSRELTPYISFDLLDFEGVGDTQQVLDFYSNLGYSFSEAALGFFENSFVDNTPSGNTSISFSSSLLIMVVNATNGFDGLSFYYSAVESASVEVYSELDATGSLLSTQKMVEQNNDCDVGVAFCNWSRVRVAFNGRAKSVQFNFNGPGDFLVDDMEFELVSEEDETCNRLFFILCK
jgi:hypothetical protein